MDKIKFVTDEGETVEFYVEEQTRVNGTDYLLVTDSMDDEANAYILKDSSDETDPEADYVMVEDDFSEVYRKIKEISPRLCNTDEGVSEGSGRATECCN